MAAIAHSDATEQLGQNADAALFIHYLSPRELARGSLGIVCHNWLKAHRMHSFLALELNAGLESDMRSPPPAWQMASAHGSVHAFLRAPWRFQDHVARSAKSLKLNIAHGWHLLMEIQKWKPLSFERLERLEINGNFHMEQGAGVPVTGPDGVRLVCLLRKLSPKVKKLLLRASFSDQDDCPSDAIMSTIVSSFPNLEELDIPWPELGCCLPLGFDPTLYVKGLAADINDFPMSFLPHVPHLRRLHIHICNWRAAMDVRPEPDNTYSGVPQRCVYDCSPFFEALDQECPRLNYLHIDFAGWGLLDKQSFRCIPRSVKRLVVGLEGVSVQDLRESDDDPETACQTLRTYVPEGCKLFVLKNIFSDDLESTEHSDPQNAVCSEGQHRSER